MAERSVLALHLQQELVISNLVRLMVVLPNGLPGEHAVRAAVEAVRIGYDFVPIQGQSMEEINVLVHGFKLSDVALNHVRSTVDGVRMELLVAVVYHAAEESK